MEENVVYTVYLNLNVWEKSKYTKYNDFEQVKWKNSAIGENYVCICTQTKNITIVKWQNSNHTSEDFILTD